MTAHMQVGHPYVRLRGQSRLVDKTGQLAHFLADPPKAALFTRPRGFGKTSTLNLLADFLDTGRDSRERFAHLDIAGSSEVCRRWQNNHPVILLSLANARGQAFEEVLQVITGSLSACVRSYPDLCGSARLDLWDRADLRELAAGKCAEVLLEEALAFVCRVLHRHCGSRAVLLVDDCDTPIESALTSGFHGPMRRFMTDFFATGLQGNEDLEFAVLTAGHRPDLEGVFCEDGGPVRCFGEQDEIFDDMFGFTAEEAGRLMAGAGLEQCRERVLASCVRHRVGGRELYGPGCLLDILEMEGAGTAF